MVLKVAFKLVLLPLIFVVVIVKIAVIVALGVALIAVIIPFLVIGALCAAPFAVGFLLR